MSIRTRLLHGLWPTNLDEISIPGVFGNPQVVVALFLGSNVSRVDTEAVEDGVWIPSWSTVRRHVLRVEYKHDITLSRAHCNEEGEEEEERLTVLGRSHKPARHVQMCTLISGMADV